jgi:hypothetical protein
MNIIFEALFVGLYAAILFNILFYIIKNEYILLFVFGFLKHFLSYYVGIQTFFCNHGYACKKIYHNNTIFTATDNNLFIVSLIEAMWFLIIGSIVFKIIGKFIPFIVMFFIAFFTHLLVEKLDIHKYFCKHNCVRL